MGDFKTIEFRLLESGNVFWQFSTHLQFIHTFQSNAVTFYPWKITIFCPPQWKPSDREKKLMNDWHPIHRNTPKNPQNSKEYRGTNEQTPPMSHTSICQMCHIQIQDSADWILMKLDAFHHGIPALSKSSLFQTLLTGSWIKTIHLTISLQYFQNDKLTSQ